MRKFLMLVVALAAVLAACGPTAQTTSDPYELVRRSQSATWDRLQVDVGITVSGSEAFSIDPSALRFAVDTEAGKVNVHIALPIAALGDAATELQALGITGETLELDVIWDGDALYAKSPLGNVLAALMIQAGEIPTGDMTGWLKLMTKAEFESLVDMVGGGAGIPDPDDLPIPSAADAATMKSQLEEMGITLTHAGTASRNGADVDKVTGTVDLEKLAQSETFQDLNSDSPLDLDPEDGTLSFDLYFDRPNARLVGIDIHAASKSDPTETAEVTINIHDPDAGVGFDAPAGATEVPLLEMLGTLFEAFGGDLFPS
jgi:hypothetical protein